MFTIRCRLAPRRLSLSWACFLLVLWLSPLTASAVNLTGLAITPPNPTIQAGKNIQLTATGSYDDVTQLVITKAKQVSAGTSYTCALSPDGTIKCWGSNGYGQLGNGTITSSSTPVAVSGLSTAVAVSAGGTHTCAVLTDGTIKCWGANGYGQLGNGPTTYYTTPTPTLSYLPLVWSSNNLAVASVNSIGLVQALASGTAPITASTGSISASTTVTVISDNPPVAANMNLMTLSGVLVNWTPVVVDADGDPVSCRLGTPPANGTATIASDCSSGTYQSNPGFVGTDSFIYIANDGQFDSNPGTVTVAVTEGTVDQICVKNNPVSIFTQTGKQGTLTITFTGNITSHTNKEVKVCPGTTLSYKTASTKGPVVCRIKNNTAQGSGMLHINDHLKCTDKPAGKDKVWFKVKSGVK